MLLIFALAVSACASPPEEDPANVKLETAANLPPDDLDVAYVHTRWATDHTTSITTLMTDRNWSFVGEVTALDEQLNVDIVPGDDGPQPTVAGKPTPAAGRTGPPTMPISIFRVRITDVISGDLAVGETVLVRQTGGYHVQSTGETIKVVLEGDELLEAGMSYLFFASPNPEKRFQTSPVSRMKAAGGSFEALEGWGELPAFQQIAAASRADAEKMIAAEAAEAIR